MALHENPLLPVGTEILQPNDAVQQHESYFEEIMCLLFAFGGVVALYFLWSPFFFE